MVRKFRRNLLSFSNKKLFLQNLSGCSSVGRVLVWGARSRRFKSCHPDNSSYRLLRNAGLSPALSLGLQNLSGFSLSSRQFTTFAIMQITDIVLEIRNGRKFSDYQSYFKTHSEQIGELIDLVQNKEKYPLEEYSSWILSHLVKSQKEEVQVFYNNIVDLLLENENQSVRRNMLVVILNLKLSAYKESEFIDLLISYIQDYETKVAAQVNAMYILAKFVLLYPDLKPEILEIIELHAEKKTYSYDAGRRKFIHLTRRIQ